MRYKTFHEGRQNLNLETKVRITSRGFVGRFISAGVRVRVRRPPCHRVSFFYASVKEAVFPSNLFDQSRSLAAFLSLLSVAASRGIM